MQGRQGFTLVEIMVAVAVIGLLAAIGIPAFNKARSSSVQNTKNANARLVNNKGIVE